MIQSAPLPFWLALIAMIAVALAFVLPRLVAGKMLPPGRSRAGLNAELYRGALADLEHERASGALTADEFAQARAELERRAIDEIVDDDTRVPRTTGRTTAIVVAMLFPVAAIALYMVIGSPAAIDGSPLEATAQAREDPVAFRRQLVTHLATNPRDGRGWMALARLDFAADRFSDAATSFAQAVEASPKVARDPDVWCEYADALGMAQGGSLAGKPTELIGRALSLDATNPRALEMAGSAAYERRDFRAAARYWKELLVTLPAESPSHRELAAAIVRAESLAKLSLPPDPGFVAPRI